MVFNSKSTRFWVPTTGFYYGPEVMSKHLYSLWVINWYFLLQFCAAKSLNMILFSHLALFYEMSKERWYGSTQSEILTQNTSQYRLEKEICSTVPRTHISIPFSVQRGLLWLLKYSIPSITPYPCCLFFHYGTYHYLKLCVFF